MEFLDLGSLHGEHVDASGDHGTRSAHSRSALLVKDSAFKFGKVVFHHQFPNLHNTVDVGRVFTRFTNVIPVIVLECPQEFFNSWVSFFEVDVGVQRGHILRTQCCLV